MCKYRGKNYHAPLHEMRLKHYISKPHYCTITIWVKNYHSISKPHYCTSTLWGKIIMQLCKYRKINQVLFTKEMEP